MINRYWSCSKFADYIRGVPKPEYETGDGWKQWEIATRQAHPVRYWLAEDMLDYVQRTVTWPYNKIYNAKYYIVNRWVTKTHALTSDNKSLKRGDWHDLDTRILYCLFDELVNFVEVEKAYQNIRHNGSKKAAWWQKGVFRTRTWKSAADGLEHLRWEAYLEDGNDVPTQQAESARWVLNAYDWWVNQRPKRVDPYVLSGWSAYIEDQERRGIGLLETDPEEDKWDVRGMLDKIRQMEEQYHEEDTRMLIQLIEHRRSLWI